jgi:hypothetical protein
MVITSLDFDKPGKKRGFLQVPCSHNLGDRANVMILTTRVMIFLMLSLAHAFAAEGVDYTKDIKPMLAARCYTCHGALKQKKDLRLDTAEFIRKGGKNGPVVVAGKPDESTLIERVVSPDGDERMPPEHEGEPFTAAQVTLLREWIAAGAPAPADEKPQTDPKEHWAFRQRVRPAVPVVVNAKWVRNPIDAFISKQHEEHGLTPQPEASRAVLLRRLYLDLIGLPPTPGEITAFENDAAPDWYERVVNRLLDDPRHGERWARHWMDIWRYSDWWGLGEQHRSSQKHMWHWRDWIVESLNADTPYDEMIRLMLAADESHPADLEKLRATGFLARNWFLFNRNSWLDETVEHVSKAFLGLTMNCAKCHDHKYDPIAQTDYYRMRAFFEPYHVRLDMVPGEANLVRDGIPRVFDGPLDTPTYRFVRGDESKPDKSKIIAPGVPAFLAFKDVTIQPVSLPAEAWQPERRAWVLDAHLSAARKNVESAAPEITKAQAKLAAAEKRHADLLASNSVTPTTPIPQERAIKPVPSPSAITEDFATLDAKAELNVAELALALAKAELASLESRADAMRASWAKDDAESEKAVAAVRAERTAMLAKARHSVAVAELRMLRAGSKAGNVEKDLKAAQASLEKATKSAGAPVNPDESYARPYGALWTPTRFLNSGKDDPTVEFGPKSSGRRTALADWITDARNPLTARVAVNHLWTRHMGTPLVTNVFEFGLKSAPLTHPELLDWLASELVEHGWSMKHLHRLIVTSAAYRMSSSAAGGEANVAKDPDNLRWWRRSPIRIEAEVVRDSILALTGELDPAMGGPSVPTDGQSDSKRRSLYFFHSDNERNLFLTTFDEASVKECYRREQSIVPQQALALLNSRLVHDGASLIAKRLAADVPSGDDVAFVRQAFRDVLSVMPHEPELAACVKAMEGWRKLPDTTPDQARAHLVWALLNHNDFVTLR